MPPKTDNKKKARDDALQFLETLEINDDEETPNSQPAETTVSSAEVTNADDGGSDEKKDPKSMLKFIDDLTESAKRSGSPPADSTAAEPQPAESAPEPVSASGNSWSWGGIWGQAAALVEQNSQLKSGLGKLKESIEQVRQTETSKAIGSRVKTLVNQENFAKLSGDLKRSLDTVIDSIAPPIQEHEVFTVHLANNIRDAGIESVVYRTMDAVFDFHGCGEINVKSASQQLSEAPEMQTKRGDTFTLPKGFDGGYGAAVTAIQYIQHTTEAKSKTPSPAAEDGQARAGSPLFNRAHKTELLVAIQPFSVIPIEDQGFLGLCVVLRDVSRGVTLRTFSQMLPLSCWALPRDQIVAADVDVSLGSSVNMGSDSVVHRRQEMNEECLYEAVMLAIKTVSNEYLTMRPAVGVVESAI
ncbi:hypothetical protein H4S04_006098 [Coemansia sp. S16]|nr:hypothetical protein H4S03_000364 [Coemansia sp. S3946]KAJ2044632.1 hypothetical protein H4S04_006098 [Coemansia sp. S16]KAJ2101506.1 hypothetical protein GGI09_001721 [Coemansia sp. S100]